VFVQPPTSGPFLSRKLAAPVTDGLAGPMTVTNWPPAAVAQRLEAVEGRLDDEVFPGVAVGVDLELVEDVGPEGVRRLHGRHREAVDGHREDDLGRVQRVDEDVDVVDVG
jgi:hypothetical protein